MEINIKKTSSQDLMSCGDGGGLNEKLLLKPKPGGSLQTQRVQRSSVLERLQRFLPQMAEANEQLKQQIERAPAGYFDIERVDDAQRVIEMDVALVELSGSDDDSEGEEDEEKTSDSEEESDSSEDSEITEKNLKLPGQKGKKKKANIQVVSQEGE